MKSMDILVDLQFGSTGKGALAGYLSEKNDYTAVVSCNMPNAGHTAYSPDTGDQFVHKVLPSGIFGESLQYVCIGPGAVFDVNKLVEEWGAVVRYRYNNGKTVPHLLIHETATVLLPKHKEKEAATLSRIASTMQGSAEAMISRVRREPEAIIKNNAGLLAHIDRVEILNHQTWLDTIISGRGAILAEGSQGYSLGISAGFYPYCTSRDCTPARVISDCGLPVKWLRHTYGCARVHPIRVGNTSDGHSGDWYKDQREISFSDLGVPEERTTVTQRVRRIATFSEIQIREAMMMAMPDEVFLNFYQYDTYASSEARGIINEASEEIGCGTVTLVGTGPLPSDIKRAY